MMNQEEAILTQTELEIPPAESEVSVPVDDKPEQPQSRPWGYVLAGMMVTLLAVGLGVVLGYMVRPAVDA